jgi:hypothetical protein
LQDVLKNINLSSICIYSIFQCISKEVNVF